MALMWATRTHPLPGGQGTGSPSISTADPPPFTEVFLAWREDSAFRTLFHAANPQLPWKACEPIMKMASTFTILLATLLMSVWRSPPNRPRRTSS